MPPRSLRGRLLVAFLVVIVAAIGTEAISVLIIGPRYFAEAMRHLPGDPMGDAMAHARLGAFTEAMTRALLAATITAIATAAVVSLAVAAWIAKPTGGFARGPAGRGRPLRRTHAGGRAG